MYKLLFVLLFVFACKAPPVPEVIPPVKPLVITPDPQVPQHIPPGAIKYRRILMQAWQFYFALGESPSIGFAQVHQESSFQCEAKSPVGAAGCAQFMPATAAWIQSLLPKDIQASCPSKSGCPFDPKWAFQAMAKFDYLLWTGASWALTPRDRWGVTLAEYNGGQGNLNKERSGCAATTSCNPAKWFNGIELLCLRATSACIENRAYPRKILDTWAPRYFTWLS